MQTASDKARKAKQTVADAPKKAKSGVKRFIKKQAEKVVKRMSEETVDEAVYGGKKEEPKDNRYTVTAADKKANTPAYQNYMKGDKRYKMVGEENEIEEGIGMTMAKAMGTPPVMSKRYKLQQALMNREVDKTAARNKKRRFSGKAANPQASETEKKQSASAKTTAKEEYVDEKLNLKTAEMGKVIKDFQKSDAPQFKGRTKEDRRQMAIAAKLTAERGGKKLGEQQEVDGNESKEKQMLASRQKMMQKQYMLDKMRLQMQKQGKLPTGHHTEETEVIDERRREDKGKPRPAEPSAAFKAVSKMMGSSRLGVQPRGVKKEPGKKPPVAGEFGAPRSPAQKLSAKRAAAKRAQDSMSSRFD